MSLLDLKTCIYFCTTIIITASSSTTVDDKGTRNHTDPKHNNTSDGSTDLEHPTALPLYGSLKSFRYRRQHPSYTIVKHVLRTTKRTKPRRRVKRPKIKYGPPNYNYGEPISYYKPAFSHLDEGVGGSEDIGGETIFPSMDHFNGLHIEGTDFELPPTSYEAQSMDLDFYNHNLPSYSYPSNSKFHKHYEEESVPEAPVYHAPSEYAESRKPHKTYGLPKEYEPTDGYPPLYENLKTLTNVNDDYNKSPSYSQHLEQSNDEPTSKNSYHTSSSYDSLSPPATKYGVPVLNSQPKNEYNPTAVLPPAYHTPNFDDNPYALYEKRIPNTGYSEGESRSPDSYASQEHYELPELPKDPHSNIEITYSPSYEINIPENTYGGNFAEPPPEHVDHTHVSYPHAASPASHPTQDYTVEPSTQHHITTGHNQQESESEDSTRYLRPTSDLPLNQHQNRPTYDYPKTSYQVPIYDPTPFDGTPANEREEHYPPHATKTTTSIDPPISQAPITVRARERAPSRQPTRKKNRVRGTNAATRTIISSNKHILDVPELEQAFEADNRQSDTHNPYVAVNSDADVNESNQVEERHRYGSSRVPFTPTILPEDSYAATHHVWDPMRVRTTATATTTTTAFLRPLLSAATKESRTINSNNTFAKRRKQLINRRPLAVRAPLQTRPDMLEANVGNILSFGQDANRTNFPVSIISIEKSHSKSYYDGTMSPPTLVTSAGTPAPAITTAVASVSGNTTTKRTTNSIFDTTVFKTPRNNYNYNHNTNNYNNNNNQNNELRDVHQIQLSNNLPKNHKYF